MHTGTELKEYWKKRRLSNVWYKYMISSTLKASQLRIFIIRNILWIFKSFATNVSWCIQWHAESFIGNVFKLFVIALSSGNLPKDAYIDKPRKLWKHV